MPEGFVHLGLMLLAGEGGDRQVCEAAKLYAAAARLGPWKELLAEGWNAWQTGLKRSAFRRYALAAFAGYPLALHNAATIAELAPEVVHESGAAERNVAMFCAAALLDDPVSMRKVGMALLAAARKGERLGLSRRGYAWLHPWKTLLFGAEEPGNGRNAEAFLAAWNVLRAVPDDAESLLAQAYVLERIATVDTPGLCYNLEKSLEKTLAGVQSLSKTRRG